MQNTGRKKDGWMASALGNRGLTIRKRIFLTNSIMVLLSLMLPLPGAQGIMELTSLQALQGVCAGYGIQSDHAGTAGIFLHSLICVREPGMLYL